MEHSLDRENEFSVADVVPLHNLLKDVKGNLDYVQEQWSQLKDHCTNTGIQQQQLLSDEVLVSKTSLARMSAECEEMKILLPKLFNTEVFSAASRLGAVEESLCESRSTAESLGQEVHHWRNQLENATVQAQKDKQTSLGLQLDVQDLTGQLTQQSEFSASLGSTLATLLWSVSRQETGVTALLTGPPPSDQLLSLTSTCVHSYLQAYKGDQWPERTSDEANFILALCGTVTNLAASSLGREHLSSAGEGQRLLDTFLEFIKEAPPGKCCYLTSLMLTALYNVSINQKGVNYLCNRPQLISLLAAHLHDESNVENRVNTLRLIQSVVCDEGSPHIALQLQETLPVKFLQDLASSGQPSVQQLALDLLVDLRDLTSGTVEQ